MTENRIAFFIWLACAVLFFAIGISCFFAKKPVGFWANAPAPKKVSDLTGYNRAVGRLFCVFAVVFALLGIPLLMQHSAAVMLSVVGTMLAIIVMMIAYIKIEQKYKSK